LKLKPSFYLRAEAAAWLALALWAYPQTGGTWGWLALLFLVPDLGLLGYLASPAAGDLGYNLTHWELPPLALAAGLWMAGKPALLWLPLVWLIHIVFDRLMGFGLKRPGMPFKQTHLQD
jgi:hypothetical protein